MVAREWLERGRRADSSIDSFTDFWRGFNNLYGHGRPPELTTIKAYLAVHTPSSVALKIISTHVSEVDYLISKPIADMRNGRDTASAIAAFHATDDPVKQLIEIFAMIYQVRCNLQHGQKSPTASRDLRLCESSSAIVAAVLESSTNP